MKIFNDLFSIILLILCLVLLTGVIKLSLKKDKIPDGKVLVTQEFIDSLNTIANMQPIIVHDTIYIYDTIIKYEEHTPIVDSIYKDSTNSVIRTYIDSLKKNDIDVDIKFDIKGTVEGKIKWYYKPIIREITTVIKQPVPYPVPYEVEKSVYKTGYYLSLTGGGNKNMFMAGSDIDIVTKNDYIYGIQYRRFGKEDIFGIKIGININKLIRNGP